MQVDYINSLAYKERILYGYCTNIDLSKVKSIVNPLKSYDAALYNFV